ncbi:MAG: nucleoside deaminase [Alphaproteobacteria bacterium]|nr:nucleoside deaminase [Alphaproteobacteria bacterium]
MRAALEEAKTASDLGEVPIGAVLVDLETGKIVAAHGNRTRTMYDPTAHAEILCIREICSFEKAQRAPGYDIYVTLEPCAMCAATISFARLNRVIFGAHDPKGGGILHGGKFYDQPTCHHRPQITHGILADECSQILKNFFKSKR